MPRPHMHNRAVSRDVTRTNYDVAQNMRTAAILVHIENVWAKIETS